MSDSQEKPWSDDPNAPEITYDLYFTEKAWFAGNLIASLLYGIVIIVFFQCMAALFNPVYRRGEPIKWGLVSFAVITFSLVTVGTTMQLYIQSLSYVDNRMFPGGSTLPPGPYGYQQSIAPTAISVVQDASFVLNNWLADGLLLYRCYAFYSMDFWVIAFPCLVYLGSLAMGTVYVYQRIQPIRHSHWSYLPYFSISTSLNVLLTLMIVIRIILCARNTRTALGRSGISRLFKAVVIMLIESCALYAVNSLLVIVPWGAENAIWNFFLPVLTETQVIAPLLIIHRVANKATSTSNSIVSGRISSFKARTRGKLTGSSDADESGMNSYEFGAGIKTLDIGPHMHQDKI